MSRKSKSKAKRKREEALRDNDHAHLHANATAAEAAAHEQLRQQNRAPPVDPQAWKKVPLVSPSQTFTGVVSMTWATGVATGGAHFTFPTAAAANAFLDDYYAGKLGLPKHLQVELLGTRRVTNTKVVGKQMPPIKRVSLHGHTTTIFDVSGMKHKRPTDLARLRYVAVIRSGLVRFATEDALMDLIRPHTCVIMIKRRASNYPESYIDPARPFFFVMPQKLVFNRFVSRSQDTVAMRAGVHVTCEDLGRVEEIRTLAIQVAADVKTPRGDTAQVDVTFEFRATFTFNRYFLSATEDVHLYATSHGVTWHEKVTQRDTPHVKLCLRGPCRDVLEKVVVKLEVSTMTMPPTLVDPVLRRPFNFDADSKQWILAQEPTDTLPKHQKRQKHQRHEGHAVPAGQRTQTTTPLAIASKQDHDSKVLPSHGPARAATDPGFQARRLVEIPGTGVEPVRQLREKAPLVTASAPPVITHKTLASVVSLTWATTTPTKSVRLTFETAAAANAFVRSFYAGKLKLPPQCTVELIGFVDAENAEAASEQRQNRCWRWNPNIPPLTPVPMDHRVAWLFDEKRVATMEMKPPELDVQMLLATTAGIARFRFVAVVSDFQIDLTKDAIVQLVKPHQCVVDIPRDARHDAGRHVDRATRLVNTLDADLMLGNTVEFSDDPPVMRAGIHVFCSDLERATLLKMDAIHIDDTVDTPPEQTIHTVVTYEFRALLASDFYRCVKAGITEARAYARNHGVSWWCEEASGDKMRVRLLLRSTYREEVENVVAMLDALVECEPLVDPILQKSVTSNAGWERLGNHLFAASLLVGKTCLRVSQSDRLIWIYGAEKDRHAMIHKLKKRRSSDDVDALVVAFVDARRACVLPSTSSSKAVAQ